MSQQLIFKYSMFLCSMLDKRYEWFYKDQESTGQLQSLLVAPEDFETMVNYFRTACVKNDMKKPAIVNFLDWLVNHKEELCTRVTSFGRSDSLILNLE